MKSNEKVRTRILALRELRRKMPKIRICPRCTLPMKGKGARNNKYWKCRVCKLKIFKNGEVRETVSFETKAMSDYQIRESRKEVSKRKLIKKLKKQKYYPVQSFELEGLTVHLKDYDVDGISFEDKKELERIRKEQEKERKKLERKEKRKARKRIKTKRKTKVKKKE